jgi:1,4-dihydroxy-2-naphthoate octaprenyltransferase
MREQFIDGVQHAASGKAALTVVIGTATAPSWIEWAISQVQSELFVAVGIILGILVSVSIFVINIQSFLIRRQTSKEKNRQDRIRTALLEAQAADKNITVD